MVQDQYHGANLLLYTTIYENRVEDQLKPKRTTVTLMSNLNVNLHSFQMQNCFKRPPQATSLKYLTESFQLAFCNGVENYSSLPRTCGLPTALNMKGNILG